MAIDGPSVKRIKVGSNQYAIFFRCPNCGHKFEKAIQKGIKARGMGGICPHCGVKDGQPDVGAFHVIKLTDEPETGSPYHGVPSPHPQHI